MYFLVSEFEVLDDMRDQHFLDLSSNNLMMGGAHVHCLLKRDVQYMCVCVCVCVDLAYRTVN